MGSSGFSGFIAVRPGSRRVHPGLQDSMGFALGVIGFIRGRWGASSGAAGVRPRYCWVHPVSLDSFGPAQVIVGFIRGRSVHCGAPRGSSGSIGLAGVRHGNRREHAGSLGSWECALGMLSGVAVFLAVRPGYRRVHSLDNRGAHLGSLSL